MMRPRRNDSCPCGSGRKYKACCIRSETQSDPTEHPLLKEAIECFSWGFFDGAVKRCEQLESLSPQLETVCSGVAWLSRIYSGRKHHHEVAKRSSYIKRIIYASGQGGPCLAEIAWLYFDCWTGNRWEFPNNVTSEHNGPFHQVLSVIDTQHGVLVTFHPTAVLSLAELAVEDSANQEIAKSLLSCLLGWRSAYAAAEDLDRLATLMVKLNVPVALWADWAAFFFQHVRTSHLRDQISSKIVAAEDFRDWAAEQNRETKNVLERVLAIAPEIMRTLNPHIGWPGFADVVSNLVKDVSWSDDQRSPSGCKDPTWYGHPNIKARYFWYDMLDVHEQGFVTNGDWALICTPTDDYSMGLAQWWRLIESVFGRIVTSDLGKLFDENPQWLVEDLANLSDKHANAEAVFLKKLAVAESRGKMTLSDILLVLEKCVVKPKQADKCRSMLRLKATEYFSKHSRQILDSIQTSQSEQRLSQENINWFRNRASHVEPIGEVDACIGRLVAKQIIDLLFRPQLENWGFRATLPLLVDENISGPLSG